MDDNENHYIIDALFHSDKDILIAWGLSHRREMLLVKAFERKREREMDVNYYKDGVLPFAALVMVEVCNLGMVTLSKAAMTSGMSNFSFVVYYNALGTFILG